MKLYIEQKFWSFWGKYHVYNEDESIAFTVQGQPALGHRLIISDAWGTEVGMLKQELLHLFSTFQIWERGVQLGYIRQKFSVLKPKLEIDFKGWKVEGDIWHWHFQVKDQADRLVARVDQEIWHITDHYVIEAVRDEDILDVLMLALAISAVKSDNVAAASTAN